MGLGEGYAPPFFGFFFYKNITYYINRVQNLTQNAGNGHFRDSDFQKFLGEHALPDPANHSRNPVPSALVVYPSPHLKPLDPPLFIVNQNHDSSN